MDDSSDNQRLLRMLSTDDGSAILATDLRKSDVPDVALDSPSLAIPMEPSRLSRPERHGKDDDDAAPHWTQ